MGIQPIYVSLKIFDNDLVAIHKKKVTLTLNKPAYIGICILELSQLLMYEFHYDSIQNKYGKNSRLLFTDTDTLLYETKTEDIYKDFTTIKKFLTLVIIHLSQNIMVIQTN